MKDTIEETSLRRCVPTVPTNLYFSTYLSVVKSESKIRDFLKVTVQRSWNSWNSWNSCHTSGREEA
jgi:hypothetical protein